MKLLQYLLWLLVVIHFAIIGTVVAAFFVLPFKADWSVAAPLMVYITYLLTTRVECPLTNLENFLRTKLGKKKITGFVGFYLYRPVKKFLLKKFND